MSDGAHTLVLGTNGDRSESEGAPGDLAEEASEFLAAVREKRSGKAGQAPEVDPSVRKALRALGYLPE